MLFGIAYIEQFFYYLVYFCYYSLFMGLIAFCGIIHGFHYTILFTVLSTKIFNFN